MGKQSYFVWKGIDCRSKGVIMQSPAPVIRPEERVSHIEIPGRAGDLTQLQSRIELGSFNSYIQTAQIAVPGVKMREILNWLKGDGYVTFSTDPDRRQKARVIGAITLNKHSYNLDWFTGEVQFYCQPLKERLAEELQTINSGDATKIIVNNGDLWARPLVKLTTTATSVWFQFTKGNNYRRIDIDMSNLSNQDIYVDCETMEVYDSPRTGWMTWRATVPNWPVLYAGENTLTGGGWSKAVITKRERFL